MNNLTQLPEKGSGYFNEAQLKQMRSVLGNDMVTNRFFFVRHGVTVGQEEGLDIKPPEDPLSDSGSKKVEIFSKNVQRILGENSTCIHYDKNTIRTEQTADQIGDRNNINIFPELEGLVTTNKKGENKNVETLKASLLAGEFIQEYTNNIGSSEFQNHIFVIHRGTKAGVKYVLEVESGEKIELRSNKFKNLGILEYDIGSDNKPIYNGNYRILQLTSENVIGVLKVLKHVEGLQDVYQAFLGKKISIWELQNYVNAFLRENHEIIHDFIRNGEVNKSFDFYLYSVSYLLGNHNFGAREKIKKSILGLSYSQDSNQYEELFGLLYSNRDSSDLWIDFFILNTDSLNDDLLKRIELEGDNRNKLTSLFKLHHASLQSVKQTFNKSLDELVKNQDGLIERKITIKEKKESKEEIITTDFLIDKFLKGAYDTSHLVLLANVGEGKSTQLAKIYNDFIIKNGVSQYNSAFITSGELNQFKTFEQVKDYILSRIYNTNDISTLLFIDGIDELKNDFKTDIKQYIHSLDIFTLLGSRKSEFQEYGDKNYHSMGFNRMETDEVDMYLEERLTYLGVEEDELKGKKQEIYDFIEKGYLDEELQSTPLVLFFLCKLVSGKNKLFRLENIDNRANLYEAIVLSIFDEHQIHKESLGYSGINRDLLFETLGYCAYLSYTGEIIDKKDIDTYLQNSIKRSSKEERNLIIEQIFLLYKGSNNGYQFILKSFQEYFLAEYIIQYRGNDFIYSMRDDNSEDWNKWRDNKDTVLFYAEMLINNKRYDELYELLGEDGLLKNDDMFGTNYLICIEILVENNFLPTKKLNFFINCYINTLSLSNDNLIGENVLTYYKRKNYPDQFFYSILDSSDIDLIVDGELNNFFKGFKINFIKEVLKHNHINYGAELLEFCTFNSQDLVRNHFLKEIIEDMLNDTINDGLGKGSVNISLINFLGVFLTKSVVINNRDLIELLLQKIYLLDKTSLIFNDDTKLLVKLIQWGDEHIRNTVYAIVKSKIKKGEKISNDIKIFKLLFRFYKDELSFLIYSLYIKNSKIKIDDALLTYLFMYGTLNKNELDLIFKKIIDNLLFNDENIYLLDSFLSNEFVINSSVLNNNKNYIFDKMKGTNNTSILRIILIHCMDNDNEYFLDLVYQAILVYIDESNYKELLRYFESISSIGYLPYEKLFELFINSLSKDEYIELEDYFSSFLDNSSDNKSLYLILEKGLKLFNGDYFNINFIYKYLSDIGSIDILRDIHIKYKNKIKFSGIIEVDYYINLYECGIEDGINSYYVFCLLKNNFDNIDDFDKEGMLLWLISIAEGFPKEMIDFYSSYEYGNKYSLYLSVIDNCNENAINYVWDIMIDDGLLEKPFLMFYFNKSTDGRIFGNKYSSKFEQRLIEELYASDDKFLINQQLNILINNYYSDIYPPYKILKMLVDYEFDILNNHRNELLFLIRKKFNIKIDGIKQLELDLN